MLSGHGNLWIGGGNARPFSNAHASPGKTADAGPGRGHHPLAAPF
ncbi:hypothetical protein ALSL_0039 [Aerosticca soli]|uniref:Uncharacterized protein n=1 Tax=Aerosticca soli TaxID=2010829 RepID=A0A2Z6E2G5_9GAMM|nr:hypothetical protein ALSL_0039 [Aerosticca soli]